MFAKWKGYKLTPSWDQKITITDQCEPISKHTLPAAPKKNPKWTMGGNSLEIKLLKVVTVPSRCKLTFAVTIPKELKDVAKVNKAGDIVLAGRPKKPIKADTYTFKIQAKSPRGVVIDKAVFDMSVDIV